MHAFSEHDAITRKGKVRSFLVPSPEAQLWEFAKHFDAPIPSWNVKTPIESWYGIFYGDKIWRVEYSFPQLGGVLRLEVLPRGVTHLSLTRCGLRGQLNLDDLPGGTVDLHLNKNFFSGPISLDLLPVTLQILNLSNNRLCGSLSFDLLPLSLLKVYLQSNIFGGAFRLHEVPDTVRVLDLSSNRLMGLVNVTSFSTQKNQIIKLSRNELLFEPDITHPNIEKELHSDFELFLISASVISWVFLAIYAT